jgi:hypothetical protein
MEELRGSGNGGAIFYARVAIVSDNEGRLTLSSSLLTEAFRLTRRGAEPLGIALVASSAVHALSLPLPPGLELTAIIGEKDEAIPQGLNFPLITGVPGILTTAVEGALIAADPEKGIVWPNPTPQFLVALQAERERPRFLIGSQHTAATTQTGHEVRVWASISYRSELMEAITGGVDGVAIEPFGDLLAPWWDAAAEQDFLTALAPLGGGDVVLYADFSETDLPTYFRLAAHCRLRLAFAPESLPQSAGDFRAYLEGRLDTARENAETGETLALPSLVANVSDLTDPDLPAFDAVLLNSIDSLADTELGAFFGLPPLYVALAENLEGLRFALGAGATGILVAPDAVADAKAAIRAL